MPQIPSASLRQALLSQQVTGSRYFFLDLARGEVALDARTRRAGKNATQTTWVDRDTYAYYVLEYVAEERVR